MKMELKERNRWLPKLGLLFPIFMTIWKGIVWEEKLILPKGSIIQTAGVIKLLTLNYYHHSGNTRQEQNEWYEIKELSEK